MAEFDLSCRFRIWRAFRYDLRGVHEKTTVGNIGYTRVKAGYFFAFEKLIATYTTEMVNKALIEKFFFQIHTTYLPSRPIVKLRRKTMKTSLSTTYTGIRNDNLYSQRTHKIVRFRKIKTKNNNRVFFNDSKLYRTC